MLMLMLMLMQSQIMQAQHLGCYRDSVELCFLACQYYVSEVINTAVLVSEKSIFIV